MTGLITLRRPIVTSPDPEPLGVAPLPLIDEDGQPLDWTFEQAKHLRFARWRAERGDFDGDRFGLRPETMPPIVREVTE